METPEGRSSLTPAALATEFAELTERLRCSTVEVSGTQRGGGSGVIWYAHGLIITNAHVARVSSPSVVLADGRSFRARLIAVDAQRDLAALVIPARNLPTVGVGDSGSLRVGELVFAVGHPWGLRGAVAVGIIHAIGPRQGTGGLSWVQADVRLAPGNSGGALADAQGRLIGINSMIADGLGLAVPSNDVTRFLRLIGARQGEAA